MLMHSVDDIYEGVTINFSSIRLVVFNRNKADSISWISTSVQTDIFLEILHRYLSSTLFWPCEEVFLVALCMIPIEACHAIFALRNRIGCQLPWRTQSDLCNENFLDWCSVPWGNYHPVTKRTRFHPPFCTLVVPSLSSCRLSFVGATAKLSCENCGNFIQNRERVFSTCQLCTIAWFWEVLLGGDSPTPPLCIRWVCVWRLLLVSWLFYWIQVLCIRCWERNNNLTLNI